MTKIRSKRSGKERGASHVSDEAARSGMEGHVASYIADFATELAKLASLGGHTELARLLGLVKSESERLCFGASETPTCQGAASPN
jgi:hypothetical protein